MKLPSKGAIEIPITESDELTFGVNVRAQVDAARLAALKEAEAIARDRVPYGKTISAQRMGFEIADAIAVLAQESGK